MSINDKVKKIPRKQLEQLALDLAFILFGEVDDNNEWVLDPDKELDSDSLGDLMNSFDRRVPSLVPKKRGRP